VGSSSVIGHSLSTHHSSERFFKKLIGRSDIKDALEKFDKLTQEESRVALAQGLKATDGVRVELQQVARGVSDLANDASDEKRS
jgi:hypothetical protein